MGLGCSQTVTIGLWALVVVGSSAATGAQEASPKNYHYVVFELGSDGFPRPQSHQFVTLADPRPSVSVEQQAHLLSGVAPDRRAVAVFVSDGAGRVTFRDVVEPVSLQRTEFGLHGESGPAFVPVHKPAFVVRAPVGLGSRLRLVIQPDPSTKSGALQEVDFDLDALAVDRSLPIEEYLAAGCGRIRHAPSRREQTRRSLAGRWLYRCPTRQVRHRRCQHLRHLLLTVSVWGLPQLRANGNALHRVGTIRGRSPAVRGRMRGHISSHLLCRRHYADRSARWHSCIHGLRRELLHQQHPPPPDSERFEGAHGRSSSPGLGRDPGDGQRHDVRGRGRKLRSAFRCTLLRSTWPSTSSATASPALPTSTALTTPAIPLVVTSRAPPARPTSPTRPLSA